jgi:hypothetical protein
MNARLETAKTTPYIESFNDPISAAYGFTHYVTREYPVTEVEASDAGYITGVVELDGTLLPVEFIDIPFYSDADPRYEWAVIDIR